MFSACGAPDQTGSADLATVPATADLAIGDPSTSDLAAPDLAAPDLDTLDLDLPDLTPRDLAFAAILRGMPVRLATSIAICVPFTGAMRPMNAR